MHFDYNEYTGINFFIQWCITINARMTDLERGLFIGYVILVLYYLIKGSRKERFFWALQPLVLAIVVLNPWATLIWVKIFGTSMQDRIFRFFWLLPILLTYAYFFSGLISKINKKGYKYLTYGCMGVAVMIGVMQTIAGTKNVFTGVYINDGLRVIENRYKIQNDTLEVAEIIENDKEDYSRAVNVIYDNNMKMEIRTYDASIKSATGEVFGYNIADQSSLAALIENENWEEVISAIVCGNVENVDFIDNEMLEAALKKIDAEYVIVQKDNICYASWCAVGNIVGETENYTVFKLYE